MTNYEKIKAMSVEEMADFIGNCDCQNCSFYGTCGFPANGVEKCRRGIGIWLEREAEEMAEWISVKDRLPEDDRNVLVYDDNDDEFYIAWREEYNNRWYSQESERLYGVTHWMPLSEPPKGE